MWLCRLIEIIWIEILNFRNVVEQSFQMTCHGGAGSFRIAPLDPLQNRLMFGDDLRHPSDLRQGQASIPIDMNLHLQDQLPYSRIARNLSDPRMKHLVRLMKGFSILRSAGLALRSEERRVGK